MIINGDLYNVYRCDSDGTRNVAGKYCAADFAFEASLNNSKYYLKIRSIGTISRPVRVFDVTDAPITVGGMHNPNRKTAVVALETGHETEQHEVWIENTASGAATTTNVQILPQGTRNPLVRVQIDSITVWPYVMFEGGSDLIKHSTFTLLSSEWDKHAFAYTLDVSSKFPDDIQLNTKILVAPNPTYYSIYCESNIYCASAGYNTMYFKCDSIPTENININVALLK